MYLIFDLDDTLLPDNKELTKYTLDILKKCQDKGHIIVINSARSMARMDNYAKEINADYTIANGGIEIYKGMELIKSSKLDTELSNACIKRILENKNIYTKLSVQCDVLLTDDPEYLKFNNQAKFHNFNNPLPSPASKILIESSSEIQVSKLASEFGLKYCRYQNGNWYRLSYKTKHDGNLDLYELLNDKKPKSIAFGDDIGDIEMLVGATIGVGLLNSIDIVKQKVSNLTDYDNNQDGVAKYLEKLLEEKVL